MSDNNNITRSICTSQLVNKDSFIELFDTYKDYFEARDNNYRLIPWQKIIFLFKIHDETIVEEFKKSGKKFFTTAKEFKDSIRLNTITNKIGGINLPNTIDYNLWGKITDRNENYIVIKKIDSHLIYYVTVFENYNVIKLKNDDNIILQWEDHFINENIFKRIINNTTYVYKIGEIILQIKN